METTESTPSKRREIWDGKCNREVWREGDGHGAFDQAVLERVKNYSSGYPGWKMYVGDVPDKIIPGEAEPPHRVYLDDLSCWRVLKSKFYTPGELGKFWPFDFSNEGTIRVQRPNRGRPAFESGDYATLNFSTRKRQIAYTFTGGLMEAKEVRRNQYSKQAVPTNIREQARQSCAKQPPVVRTAAFTTTTSKKKRAAELLELGEQLATGEKHGVSSSDARVADEERSFEELEPHEQAARILEQEIERRYGGGEKRKDPANTMTVPPNSKRPRPNNPEDDIAATALLAKYGGGLSGVSAMEASKLQFAEEKCKMLEEEQKRLRAELAEMKRARDELHDAKTKLQDKFDNANRELGKLRNERHQNPTPVQAAVAAGGFDLKAMGLSTTEEVVDRISERATFRQVAVNICANGIRQEATLSEALAALNHIKNQASKPGFRLNPEMIKQVIIFIELARSRNKNVINDQQKVILGSGMKEEQWVTFAEDATKAAE